MEFKGTKDLAYYKANAKEDYMTTPISVLRYIQELEQQKAPEMLEMLESVLNLQKENYGNGMKTHVAMITKSKEIEQLIKEATEI
jgi:hypothetical protein